MTTRSAMTRTDHLVAWVVVQRDDGHILLARRAGVSYATGLWGLPGGHVEDDETLAAAAAREVREEVGLEVDSLEPLGVTRYVDDHARGCDFFFLARAWRGVPTPVAECDDVRWCDPTSLAQPSVPWLPAALRRHLLERVWWADQPQP